MAFLNALVRIRRADLSFLVFAAFFALCVLPHGGTGATFAPQSAQAILILLGHEGSTKIEAAPPAKIERVVAGLPRFTTPTKIFPQRLARLENHEVAAMNGVRTNIRLN